MSNSAHEPSFRVPTADGCAKARGAATGSVCDGSAKMFTAAQIAAVLGMKRQAVQWHLRDIQPAGVRIVAGNETAAWTVEQLPTKLRERLAAEAMQQRCRTIEALLSMPRPQWQPTIPLDKISDADIQIATKLRDALKPWLIQQHDLSLSSAEMESRAVEDYQRILETRFQPVTGANYSCGRSAAITVRKIGTGWKSICRTG